MTALDFLLYTTAVSVLLVGLAASIALIIRAVTHYVASLPKTKKRDPDDEEEQRENSEAELLAQRLNELQTRRFSVPIYPPRVQHKSSKGNT